MDNKMPNLPKPDMFFFHKTSLLQDFIDKLCLPPCGMDFFSFWPIYRAFLFTYSSHVGTFIFKENSFVEVYHYVF